MKHLGAAFFALGLLTACPAQAESWTCTYPGFGPNRQAITIKLNSDGDDLVEQQLGVPKFHIVRDNSLAIVAVIPLPLATLPVCVSGGRSPSPK
jgi:hypothetical protein